jgi:hypothetical protein
MTEIKLTVIALAALAALVLFLYVSPFAACRNCRSRPRKRCRRCKGLGRYQRRGSRTVHRLAAAIRGEIDRTRAERAGKRSKT